MNTWGGEEEKAYDLTRGARGMGYQDIATGLKMNYAPVCPLVMGLEKRTHYVLRLSLFTSELFRDNQLNKAITLTARGSQAYRILTEQDLSSFDPRI